MVRALVLLGIATDQQEQGQVQHHEADREREGECGGEPEAERHGSSGAFRSVKT